MFLTYVLAFAAMPCLDVRDAYASSTCCQDETAEISNVYHTSCSTAPRFTAVCSEVDQGFSFNLTAYDEPALYANGELQTLRVVRNVRLLLHRDPTASEISMYKSLSNLDMQHVLMQRSDFPGTLSGLDLTGQRALVVGGSTGIGFAAAILLAQQGADVSVCARQEVFYRASLESARVGVLDADRYALYMGPVNQTEAVLSKLSWAGSCDARSSASMNALFQSLGGQLDVLIYTAGTYELSQNSWKDAATQLEGPGPAVRWTGVSGDDFRSGAIGAARTLVEAQPYLKDTSRIVVTTSVAQMFHAPSLGPSTPLQFLYNEGKRMAASLVRVYDGKGIITQLAPEFLMTGLGGKFPYILPDDSYGTSALQGNDVAGLKAALAAKDITRAFIAGLTNWPENSLSFATAVFSYPVGPASAMGGIVDDGIGGHPVGTYGAYAALHALTLPAHSMLLVGEDTSYLYGGPRGGRAIEYVLRANYLDRDPFVPLPLSMIKVGGVHRFAMQ